MTPEHSCPTCGGPLDGIRSVRLEDREFVTPNGVVSLGPQAAGIMRALLRHPSGATKESILIHAYDGYDEPPSAEKSINIILYKMRLKLKHLGYGVKTIGTCGRSSRCRYKLETIQ